MKRKLNISYEWWNESGEVNPFDKQSLESHATNRICTQIKTGFIEGELHAEFNGRTYKGYWKSNTQFFTGD